MRRRNDQFSSEPEFKRYRLRNRAEGKCAWCPASSLFYLCDKCRPKALERVRKCKAKKRRDHNRERVTQEILGSLGT